jgi:hypothetical protein
MPTVSEYARARGVSHQYISKLVKKGMPLTSFEAADQFREAHASSKPPTNPTRIARMIDEEPPVIHLAIRQNNRCEKRGLTPLNIRREAHLRPLL